MRATDVCHAWVVYRMTMHRNTAGGNVVCEQREWDVLEAERPGFHTLLHSGLRTEQEAEKLARGTAGDPVPRKPKVKTAAPLTA
jgi:hypothetical protein